MPTIKTRQRPDGKTVYTFTADVGTYADGRRRQQRFTFATKKAAQAELAKLGYQRPRGEYVPRSTATVAEIIDSYLRAALRGKEANTEVSYHAALRIPREQLGSRKAQSVTRDDIEALVDYALTAGRSRGGKPGTGLGTRSVRLMLQQLSAAFEQAVDDGKLARNPARRVKVAAKPASKRQTWSATELHQFLDAAMHDRLHAAWRLLSCGLRRGELCGLRWEDVDLDAGTITIGRARVVVGRVITKSPKSLRGYRTLPVDAATVAALKALRDLQAIEAMDASPAYNASGYVVVSELGEPVNPEWFSRREFQRLAASAGLPRIRLHDVRHTASSLMAARGVPEHIRAAWCGQTVAVNVTTYTHARPEDLVTAGAALAAIFEAA